MSEGGVRRPPGAEIVRIGHRYNQEGKDGDANFLGALKLAAPSSKDITYTFFVVNEHNKGEVLASQAKNGDGEQIVTFELHVDLDASPAVGVYATSGAGDSIYDRMPTEDFISADDKHPVDYWWSP